MRIRDLAALAALAAPLGSCASTTAPPGWLPGPTGAQEDPYGGWVTMDIWEGDHRIGREGELIAVAADSLFILEGARLMAIERYRIVSATLDRYAPAAGSMALWTTVGTLSSFSHGVGAVMSLPVWIVAGSISTNSVVKDALMRYPDTPLQSFSPYARFPGGLPSRPVHLEPRPFLRR